MRLDITARHFTPAAALRASVRERLDRSLRPLTDGAVSAQVVITRDKARYRAEVTLHARGEHFLHGEATGRDPYAAVGAAADKVDRQIQKLKGKWTDGRRRTVSGSRAASAGQRAHGGAAANGVEARDAGDGRQVRIVRARRYAVKPMSVEEAAIEVGDRLSVLVFRNAATDEINVLFRRPDGHLGWIEPEV